METKSNKNQTATDVYTLLANVVHLNVNGVATHYTDGFWVDDENDPDGGYYQPVKKLYKIPRVKIDFLAKVAAELQVGCVYSDGLNSFIATAKNEIRNHEDCVEVFRVPKEVVCVCKPYVGNIDITTSQK